MAFAISRRAAIAGSLLAAPFFFSRNTRAKPDLDAAAARDRLLALERENGGRLGVCILDAATGRRIEHRAHERFPMCSTFKFLAAAHVLARVDHERESLDRRIVYSAKDLVAYSPITEKHAGEAGMTLEALCEAAVTLSDNTAANLLLASFGGPAELTAYVRSLGDDVTRLDRAEPELNEAAPGDPRDTTTPAAMAENVRRIVLGDALSDVSRDRLTAWLVASKTGDKRLRTGFPRGWRVGDKTGSGANGATNDIAVVWPPGGAPLVVTAYFVESRVESEQRNSVLAEVARIAARP